MNINLTITLFVVGGGVVLGRYDVVVVRRFGPSILVANGDDTLPKTNQSVPRSLSSEISSYSSAQ